ncbi:MAG TPA: hypothetical protein VGO67_17460 [Verrucomicrobiae bacterium]|jgi:hypothetical protein
MNKVLLLLLLVLDCTSIFAVTIQQPQPPTNLQVLLNVALGKSYQLSPTPNYSTGPGISQLTDGKYVNGYFWTQKGSVGWEQVSPVSITLDLGTNQPILGMSFDTAAGAAQVQWPVAIFILVSQDSNTWTYAGDLAELSAQPPTNGYAVFRYQTSSLATQGRFVKFEVVPTGDFTFVDEIEVYRGSNSFLNNPAPGPTVTNVATFVATERMGASLRRRLRNDLAGVGSLFKLAPTNVLSSLQTESNLIFQAIPSTEVISPGTFSTVFPINDLHQRIFALQSAVWRASGLAGLVISQGNRWDMLNPTAMPMPTNAVVSVAMMSNEYRADAFNLSNTGTNLIQVNLTISGLPRGTNPDYVSVQELPFTDTQAGVPVAAALPLMSQQGGSWILNIPPGLTQQIWLTFHPTNVAAGLYSGQIVLASLGLTNQSIPVNLNVYPLTFPNQPTLHLTGWDYNDHTGSYYGATATNRSALISLLRQYFVDSPWADSVFYHTGTFDGTGHMTVPPSPVTLSNWLNSWPNANNYMVYLDVPDNFGSDGRFAGFAMGSTAFQQAISDWMNWWVEQLQQRGIQPEQLSLLLVDEPRTVSADNIILAWGAAIHAAQPDVVVWEDTAWPDPTKADPALYQVSDVLSVGLAQQWISGSSSFTNFYISEQHAGDSLWFYSTLEESRLLDPYSYYRLQEWFCWKYGAQGSGYWSFVDNSGTSSWNEYGSEFGGFTPLFLDAQSVTSSKHMEALREGVEDFEYLRMLRDSLAALQAKGITNAVISSASQLLITAPDQVIGGTTYSSYSWTTPKDRTVADSVRLQVLGALTQLTSQ